MLCASTGFAQSRGTLSIDAVVDIKHPSSPVFSPDGRRLAFVWERAGVQNVYVSDLSSGSGDPRPLTAYNEGGVDALFWSPDGSRVLFDREGSVWTVDANTGRDTRPLWNDAAPAYGYVPSPDGNRIAYSRERDLWVRPVQEGVEQRLTRTPERNEGGIAWSPDGTRIAFVTSSSERHENAPDYSGAKILYAWFDRRTGDVAVVTADGDGSPVSVFPDQIFRESAPRWIDDARLVFERVHDDTTRREIVVADALSGRGEVVLREIEEKWWSIPGTAEPGAIPSPDGKWLAFLSDRDGWDHVYVLPTGGGEPIAITRGHFEAWRPSWSPDGKRLAFDANEAEHPGTRHLYVVELGDDPGKRAPQKLTQGRGTNVAAVWSPDSKTLVYQHTDPENSADLFAVSAEAGATPRRLSDSLPAGIDRSRLVAPELIWYPATDGQKVPAYLFVPNDLDRAKKHPAIVWVHGDGHNQNYDGWHIQRNYAVYYSFHQYLLQRGYVVIAPDYRGSIGYGKDWRQGVFLDVGGKDSEDATEAATYLKSLDYVDPDRIGIWGLSYGGFFTLLSLVNAPKTFACGVDVAGVVDYRMYYEDPYQGRWTYGRLRAPEDNPAAYDVASPLSRMDRLERPLLILHGTADVNVPYLHSVRLIDDLLARKKDFEFMAYPGEFHYFTRERVLTDAWRRVERFFDEHLK